MDGAGSGLDYEALASGLVRDGLAHRSGRSLVLGPDPKPGPGA
jgi:hypothetical protein